MDNNTTIVISTTVYKLCSLLVGVFLAYMGFKLFMSGIWGNSGDLDSKFGNFKIVLKHAAPGTFFALFGTVVIGLTIFKGLNFESSRTTTPGNQYISTVSKLPNLPDLPEELPKALPRKKSEGE